MEAFSSLLCRYNTLSSVCKLGTVQRDNRKPSVLLIDISSNVHTCMSMHTCATAVAVDGGLNKYYFSFRKILSVWQAYVVGVIREFNVNHRGTVYTTLKSNSTTHITIKA